ncbi:MAG: hypothetical protein FJZ90_02650, partial [Chloroflexi bacterium]|nr:hypothetical protein [Chloroflexota bacterium]
MMWPRWPRTWARELRSSLPSCSGAPRIRRWAMGGRNSAEDGREIMRDLTHADRALGAVEAKWSVLDVMSPRGQGLCLRLAAVVLVSIVCFAAMSVMTAVADTGALAPVERAEASSGYGLALEPGPSLGLLSTTAGRELAVGLEPTTTVIISATTRAVSQTAACVDVGMTTTLAIYIDNVYNFGGYQMRVTFDPALLEVLDSVPDTGGPPGDMCAPKTEGVQLSLGQFLAPDCQIWNDVDNTTGVARLAIAQDPAKPGVSGSGVLAWITFKGLQAGISSITIESMILSEPIGIEIRANVISGTVYVGDEYCPDSEQSTVWGLVFQDTNGDGSQGPGEPGVANVSVVITNSLGVGQTLVTNASGYYTTTVPPGLTTADVNETTLPLSLRGVGVFQTAGSDPTIVNVPAGTTTFLGADGYQPRGQVTGIVFEDTDGDGVQDPGEPGIGDVTVVITDSLGVTQTVTTDPTGHYTATVPPGSTTADVQEETIS